jgi:hypothetical protein
MLGLRAVFTLMLPGEQRGGWMGLDPARPQKGALSERLLLAHLLPPAL